MNKLVQIFKIFLVLYFFFTPITFISSQQSFIKPLQNAYIKIKQLDWRTYEFSVRTNLADNQGLNFQWQVDKKEVFYTPRFQYVFLPGRHLVTLIVKDAYGNVRKDFIELNTSFWQITNPWLWWFVYLIVVVFIIYYWITKIIYLFYRRKVRRQAKEFLDILFDEHNFISKVIETEIRKWSRKI